MGRRTRGGHKSWEEIAEANDITVDEAKRIVKMVLQRLRNQAIGGRNRHLQILRQYNKESQNDR